MPDLLGALLLVAILSMDASIVQITQTPPSPLFRQLETVG